MQTSDSGIVFLERHEGVVLKAYRCPAGKWTIGGGLTSASGVVSPKPGMVITREEASRLLQTALKRNYEPSVAKAMPAALQFEFDGGVSFHFNTGAIGRASWVKSWLKHDWTGVRSGLLNWTKGGGKVLPGLKRRREEEFLVLRDGVYSNVVAEQVDARLAKVTQALSAENMQALRDGLIRLGYVPGFDKRGIQRSTVLAFQRDHDLTVDGILGRATLSTVERMLDARAKVKAPATGAAVTATGTQADQVSEIPTLASYDWLIWAGLAVCAIWLLWLAWSYRDALAVKAQKPFPSLAAFLRRF